MSLWFCMSLQCIKGEQNSGGGALHEISTAQIFPTANAKYLLGFTSTDYTDHNKSGCDRLTTFPKLFHKRNPGSVSNMSFCTLFWKDNKPSTQFLGAVMSSRVWKIIKRVPYVFPCNGQSVPKQSGGGLKRKLFNSASSAAAMLWVYIPPLDCLTSCDKGDSRCS